MQQDTGVLKSLNLRLSQIQAYTLGVVLVLCVLAYRRIYRHPLSSFPGPRLAALTRWYGFYYDVIQCGAFLRQKTALHNAYGDIIRIGPNELSFRDPQAYSDIYAPGSHFTKEPKLYNCFGVSKSSIGFVNTAESKERREILLPFFSRRAISQLEHVIQEKVFLLVRCLLDQGVENTPVNLGMAFRCTALEIISSYCLNHSPSALTTPGFQYPFLVSMRRTFRISWLFKYIPAILPYLMDAPSYIVVLLPQSIRNIFDFRYQISSKLEEILANPDVLYNSKRETVYHHLIGHDAADKKHRALTREELLHETHTLLGAGSDTVGNACTVGFFHVLSNPDIHNRLLRELDMAWPDKDSDMPTSALEKLPYLTGVIKESLRLSHGAVVGLPRVVGPHDTNIGGVPIPAGTIVSMSATYVHLDSTVFPNPNQFDPSRWLSPESKRLDSSLVPFSRGPRSCLGINLAWCELNYIFGTVFRHVKFSLYNTTYEDFKEFDDFFVPIHKGRELHVIAKER